MLTSVRHKNRNSDKFKVKKVNFLNLEVLDALFLRQNLFFGFLMPKNIY